MAEFTILWSLWHIKNLKSSCRTWWNCSSCFCPSKRKGTQNCNWQTKSDHVHQRTSIRIKISLKIIYFHLFKQNWLISSKIFFLSKPHFPKILRDFANISQNSKIEKTSLSTWWEVFVHTSLICGSLTTQYL